MQEKNYIGAIENTMPDQPRNKSILSFDDERMSDELLKSHIHGLPFDAVLHTFTGADKGPPHDHPWNFTSTILKGAYYEKIYVVFPDGRWDVKYKLRRAGDTFHVDARTIHQLIDLPYGTCYTIILPEEGLRTSRVWDFSESIAKSRMWHEEVWTMADEKQI